jgi:two-component system KDP operon response regulator KdpE
MEGPVLLVIEDEPQMRHFLRVSLTANGFRFIEADSGAEGIVQAATRGPEVIVLDLGLPDIDGIQVVRRIREWSRVPIIVLSARGSERDKVDALDAGADDYLTKPFGVDELLARLRVALRHAAHIGPKPEDAVFTVGDLRVDLAKRQVFVKGAEVHLTPLAYKLLVFLVQHAGKVVTHRQLLREVWGPNTTETHYLRVFMGQLRQKLESDPSHPRYLITEPGVGYRLRTE